MKNDEKLTIFNFEETLRPSRLDSYIGQESVKEKMRVFIKAALQRSESLDHVLLYGPPGLGKTTLAQIIAHELNVNIVTTSGPSLSKTGDLVAILNSLKAGDVLFIDEIHRIPKVVEEVLYSAMEDFCVNVIVGKDATARNIILDIVPFTLVGATTRVGDISSPLRDRFGIVEKLEYYSIDELSLIVKRTSSLFDTYITDDAALELARRSRGTPRVANKIYKRVRDFADVLNSGNIDLSVCKSSLKSLHITETGLSKQDIEYLKSIAIRFSGGPVGIDALSATIGEERATLEEVCEPFLLKENYIKRTSRGRTITEKGLRIIGELDET